MGASQAAAQSAPSLGAGVVTAQIASGTAGTAVGFIAGGLITRRIARARGADELRAGDRAFAGGLVGAALVTPIGPALIGNRDGARGSYLAAQGGAVAGGLASALFIAVGRRGLFDCRACGLVRVAAGIGIAFLPSVGATVAYNATRRR